MNKSNELRKVVRARLMTLPQSYAIKEISYNQANDSTMFPHIVFSFNGMNPNDARGDYVLSVDIWDKGSTYSRIEDLADDVEDLLRCANVPSTGILPTFFFEDKQYLPDEDKSIQHVLVRFTVQNYKR